MELLLLRRFVGMSSRLLHAAYVPLLLASVVGSLVVASGADERHHCERPTDLRCLSAGGTKFICDVPRPGETNLGVRNVSDHHHRVVRGECVVVGTSAGRKGRRRRRFCCERAVGEAATTTTTEASTGHECVCVRTGGHRRDEPEDVAAVTRRSETEAVPWQPDISVESLPSLKSIQVWFSSRDSPYRKYYVRLVEASPNQTSCCNDTLAIHAKLIDKVADLEGDGDLVRTEFVDRPPGNYCVRVTPHESRLRLTWCAVTEMLDLPEATAMTPLAVAPHRSGLSASIPYVGIPAALLLFAVAFFVHRRRNVPLGGVKVESHCEDAPLVASPEERRVFLVYSRDSPAFVALIRDLETFLRVRCRCRVMFDELDLAGITQNRAAWVQHQIANADKVVVVHSEGAFLRHKAWLANTPLQFRNDDGLGNLFEAAVAMLMDPAVFHDYAKLVNVRFDFTPPRFMLDHLVPLRHYELPDTVDALYSNLHYPLTVSEVGSAGMTLNNKDEPCFASLLRSIAECQKFSEANPGFVEASLARISDASPIQHPSQCTQDTAGETTPTEDSCGGVVSSRTPEGVDALRAERDPSPDDSVEDRYTSSDSLLRKNLTTTRV